MVTSRRNSLQQPDHPRGFGDAESRHRLVEQQHLRPRGERHRQLQLALLAMAQSRHHGVGAGFQPDPPQRRKRGLAQMAFLAGIAPEPERVSVMGLGRQRDVVERAEVGQQRGDLERSRQPERAAPPGRQPGDVAAGQADHAGMRRQLSGELADQRGLAGAVGADDGVQLTPGDLEREVVGGENPAKAPHQVFHAKQGLSHGATSRAARRCRRARTARSKAAAAP